MSVVAAAAEAVLLIIIVLWSWSVVCRQLRLRRAAMLEALDGRRDCHQINANTMFVEFPFLTHRSLDLGLFRTYAIPSISAILRKSGEFSANPAKRYDDTDILCTEMLHHHVDAGRGSLAIRRLNFLHSHYPISNQDFLYVLSIFILQPMEWCALYGYRAWTAKEKEAYYTAWHDIGVRMGIQDIPPTVAAVAEYKDEYERRRMVFSESNRYVADKTLELLLTSVKPMWLWPAARRVVFAMLDERLRKAMGYPAQPGWLKAACQGLLKFHGWVVRWLPPRPLRWARSRIRPGCPAGCGAEAASKLTYSLDFHWYKPWTYERGYRIQDLGSLKPGSITPAQLQLSAGELLCPLEEHYSSTLPCSSCLTRGSAQAQLPKHD